MDAVQPIRQPLDALARTLLSSLPPADRVLAAWPLVCGRRVAANSVARSFDDRVLKIVVADPTWRNELSPMAPRFAARLEQLTSVPVADILFTPR